MIDYQLFLFIAFVNFRFLKLGVIVVDKTGVQPELGYPSPETFTKSKWDKFSFTFCQEAL